MKRFCHKAAKSHQSFAGDGLAESSLRESRLPDQLQPRVVDDIAYVSLSGSAHLDDRTLIQK